LIFAGMSHHYFDVYECIAMPTVRFLEKVEPVWNRPNTKLTFPRFLFLVPDMSRPGLEAIERTLKFTELKKKGE
jgi:hypothetical protein